MEGTLGQTVVQSIGTSVSDGPGGIEWKPSGDQSWTNLQVNPKYEHDTASYILRTSEYARFFVAKKSNFTMIRENVKTEEYLYKQVWHFKIYFIFSDSRSYNFAHP